MKLINYIGMAWVMASLAACSEEEQLCANWQTDPNAVKINATVGNDRVSRTNPHATDQSANKFNENDKLQVEVTGQPSVTYTLTGGTWTPPAEAYQVWYTPNLEVTAYYPVTTGTSATAFTVPVDQSTPEKMAAADYMKYTGTASRGETTAIKLQMERQMARVVLNTRFNEEFEGLNPRITKLTIQSNDALPAKTGTVDVEAYPAAPDQKYVALVAPDQYSYTDYIKLTVEYDGEGSKRISRDLTASGNENVLSASNSYAYNLTIGKSVIQVGEVTVHPWEDDYWDNGEGEAAYIPQVDKSTHTITPKMAGYITTEMITTAMDGTNELKVNGPINGTDITNIRSFCTNGESTLRILDLSGSEIVKGGSTDGFTATENNVIGDIFQGTSLTSITLPNTITAIGSHALSYCSFLTTLTFEEGGTEPLTIGEFAFDQLGLTAVKIPNRTTTIGKSAFKGCGSLTTLTFEANGTKPLTIGESAFESSGVTAVEIPKRTTTIGNDAFSGCGSLTTLTFEKDGTEPLTIGEFAFKASGITAVEIPNRTTTIGNDAFSGCGSLTALTFEANGTEPLTIEQSAFKSLGVKAVEIPKRTTAIGNEAFADCASLEITFEEGGNEPLSIREYAFYQSGLTTVTLPMRLKTLANDAFEYCNTLKDITLNTPYSEAAKTSISFVYFSNASSCTLHLGHDWTGQNSGNTILGTTWKAIDIATAPQP